MSQESPKFLFCAQCGGKNLPSFKFCQSCGKELGASAPVPSVAQRQVPGTANNEHSSTPGGTAWTLWMIIASFVFVGSLLGFISSVTSTGGLTEQTRKVLDSTYPDYESTKGNSPAKAKETTEQREARIAAEQNQAKEEARIEEARQRLLAEKRRVEENPLELIEHEWLSEKTYGTWSTYVTGRVRNNTNKTYSYAQIRFATYASEDAKGDQVGTAVANVNGLEPGGTWKFKALIWEGNARSYRLIDVDGF